MARESTTQSRGTAQSGRSREAQSRTTRNNNVRNAAGSNAGTSAGGNVDRERAITPSREGVQGTGVARRGEFGRPAIGTWGTTNPFALMQRMADDMERFMEEFGFGRMGLAANLAPRFGLRGGGAAAGGVWSPQVEVRQRGDRMVVRADLPGVNRDDVQVDIENDVLTLRGERREEREDEREGIYRSERMYGHFSRSIPLPEGVDPDKCEATYKDGVLEISIPAPSQNQRRGQRIQIR